MRGFRWCAASVLSAVVAVSGGCGDGSENSSAAAPGGVNAAAVGDGSAQAAASAQAAPGSRGAPAASGAAPAPTSGVTSVAHAAAGTPPRLQLERASLHFGRLRENEVRQGEIRFSNVGGSVLTIADVKTTCGCTVASLPTRVLRPGETGSVGVSFDPSGPGAGQRKFVNIISNSNGESAHVTQVAIEADVDPLLVVEPRILNVGVLRLGQEFRTQLDVGFLNESFRISRVTTTNPEVTARVLDERRPPAPGSDAAAMEHGATVEVVVSRGALWGNLFSWIEVEVVGHPTPQEPQMRHEARMRLQGQVFGDVLATPDTFRFGVEANTGFEREITLTHRDGLPFELELSELVFPGMNGTTVEVIRQRPHQYVVVLRSPGSAVERNYQGIVHLKSDVAGEDTIDLRIIGVVRPTPIPIGR